MSSISVETKNDLTFIYEDMGPFICAHLKVVLSVRAVLKVNSIFRQLKMN